MPRYVHAEELFELMHAEHASIGHGKHQNLWERMRTKYCNVPRELVDAFCRACPRCISRQPRPPGRAGYKPILTRGFGVRGQVDLIDFQSSADGSYRWLLVYVDHGTKLCDVRPLTSKRVRHKSVTLRKLLDSL